MAKTSPVQAHKTATPKATRKAARPSDRKAATKTARAPTVSQTATNPSPAIREDSKLGLVIAMLRRSGGANIEELTKATGWQAHSVRGVISGSLKKKRGLDVTSEKADGVRTYRTTD